MALFGIRFDLRNPPMGGTTMTERYQAALDMTEWADTHGFVIAVLSEHHGSDDGYLPSPLVMAAAMAARTKNLRIQIAALVTSFHDPVRLAEDIAVVDRISGGRLDIVLTNGYVAREFEMFGRPLNERAKRTSEMVHALRRAWTGQPFEIEARKARVTPTPHQEGGPRLSLGGSTEPAARRAARLDAGFMPSTPEVWTYYADEMKKLGKTDPGPYLGGDTSFFHLAHDPDSAWETIAPYALHEVNSYGQWMAEAGLAGVGGFAPVEDADTLRTKGQYRVITPQQLVDELTAKGPFGFGLLHPMMGGIPPALAWESLHLLETEVMPRL